MGIIPALDFLTDNRGMGYTSTLVKISMAPALWVSHHYWPFSSLMTTLGISSPLSFRTWSLGIIPTVTLYNLLAPLPWVANGVWLIFALVTWISKMRWHFLNINLGQHVLVDFYSASPTWISIRFWLFCLHCASGYHHYVGFC